MASVFLSSPSHDGRLDMGAAKALYKTASQKHTLADEPLIQANSLLPTNCNSLLAAALNRRATTQWFAMLHSDIEPEPLWLDRLIDIAEHHRADFLSALVPIKSRHGYTSTALSFPGDPFRLFCRLTQQQVRHPSFPDTFDVHQAADALAALPEPLKVQNAPREFLLANTGCMVYRLAHWRPGICFANEDDIRLVNGQHLALYQSEDWVFSRRVAQHGGKVMATRLISLRHWGQSEFPSHQTWGHPTDIG